MADEPLTPYQKLLKARADAPRCQDLTRAGDACKQPAVNGFAWCQMHIRRHVPDWEPRPSKKKLAELERQAQREAVELRTAEILAERREAEKEANRIKGTRKGLIEALKSRFEHKPSIVTDVILEGLYATTTVRRRVLNDDGTEQEIWVEDGNGKLHSRPVYEDVVIADHKQRIEYLREIYDRIHGRPAQRKEVEGGGDTRINLNVVGMLQAAKAAEANPDGYYSSLPGAGVVDVQPLRVEDSEPAV